MGLLTGGDVNEEHTVLYGFFALIGIIPKIIYALIDGYSRWETWALIALGGTLGFLFRKIESSKQREKALDGFQRVLYLIGATCLVVGMILLSIGLGESQAKEKLSSLLINGCQFDKRGWNTCHTVKLDNKDIQSGYLVHRVGKEITMFTTKHKEMKTFTLLKDAILTRKFNSPKEAPDS